MNASATLPSATTIKWWLRAILIVIVSIIFFSINTTQHSTEPRIEWLKSLIEKLTRSSLEVAANGAKSSDSVVSISLIISSDKTPSQESTSDISDKPEISKKLHLSLRSDTETEQCTRLISLVDASRFFLTPKAERPRKEDPLVAIEIQDGVERHYHATLYSEVANHIAFKNLLALFHIYTEARNQGAQGTSLEGTK